MNKALDIEQLNATALSEILGYPVYSMSSARVGTGQTGASYRIVLDAEQGPRTLLAKVAACKIEDRDRIKHGYAAEVGFYSQLVDKLDIRTPECYYAAISDDHLHFTLLLEDLAPRVAGVQADGCPVDRARAIIRNLTGLHAPLWNDDSLDQLDFLMNIRDKDTAGFLGAITVDAAKAFTDRFSEQFSKDNATTLMDAAAVIADWIMLPQDNISLLHGDYRLDNLMFGEEVNDVVVLDWQTAAVGAPARDLAYFLGTCLEPQLRRESEQELVNLYHSELLARGISHYDAQQCFQDYRLGQFHAVMITTLGWFGAAGEQSEASDGMFLAMASRACEAIRDLDSLALLK